MQTLTDAMYLMGDRYPGGVPALAQRLDRSKHTLQNELNPNCTNAKMGAVDLLRTMQFANDFSPLMVMAEACGFFAMKMPEVEGGSDDLMVQMTRMVDELGQLMRAISEGAADGSFTPNEMRRVHREVGDLFGVVNRCVGHLAPEPAAEAPRKALHEVAA